MRWSRMFAGKVESIPAAREFVRDVCGGHAALSDAELVLAELGTNAIRHTESRDGLYVVELDVEPWTVTVAVVDMGSDSEPVAFREGADSSTATSGRGLLIVETLATKWGVEKVRDGRRVWAILEGDAR